MTSARYYMEGEQWLMRSGVRGAFNLQGNIMGSSPNAGKQWECHEEEEEEEEEVEGREEEEEVEEEEEEEEVEEKEDEEV